MRKILLLLAIFVSFFSVNTLYANVDGCNHAWCKDWDGGWSDQWTWDWKNWIWLWAWDSSQTDNSWNWLKVPYKDIESQKQNETRIAEEAQAKREKEYQERLEKCDEEGNCIDKESYMFDTQEFFGFWNKSSLNNSEQAANFLLGTLIEKLMVALWILSVLIMTVWGWYIVMYHGQDELLSKGKSIFNAGVIALVVALSSYMLVGLLRFILYN